MTSGSGWVSLTRNDTTPAGATDQPVTPPTLVGLLGTTLVVAEPVERTTWWPLIGAPLPFSSITVTVTVECPSAGALDGEAVTVDASASVGTKTMVAVHGVEVQPLAW